MSTIDDVFGTNADKEQKGVVFAYPTARGEIRVRLARAGGSNAKFQTIMEEKMRPYRRLWDSGQMPAEVANRVLQEAVSEGIVLEWDVTHDGQPVPCTPANVLDAFKKNGDFFKFVWAEATTLGNYQDELTGTVAKN